MTIYHVLCSFVWLALKEVNCVPIAPSNGTHGQNHSADVRVKSLTNALEYMKTPPETVLELKSNYSMMEGDIKIPRDRNAVKRLWPAVNGQVSVPYVISSDLGYKTSEILAAMHMISEHTCISFHKKISEVGFLLFQSSSGCASFVGYRGNAQQVYLSSSCHKGNICHEILHTLGFYHEHTRIDRDQQIEILYNNIIKGAENNFQTQNGNTLKLPYDILSILHYGRTFFSVNGKPTIVAKRSSKEMGQRTRMTELDIQRVRLLYKCDEKERKAAAEKARKHPIITEPQPVQTVSSSVTSELVTRRDGLQLVGNTSTEQSPTFQKSLH